MEGQYGRCVLVYFPSIRMMFSGAPASLTIPVSIGRGNEGNALATSRRATYPSCVCKSLSSFVARVVVFRPLYGHCMALVWRRVVCLVVRAMALDIRVRRRRVSML